MKVIWHCRDCDIQEPLDIDITKLDLKKKFFDAIISYIKEHVHKTCNGDIGVKSL